MLLKIVLSLSLLVFSSLSWSVQGPYSTYSDAAAACASFAQSTGSTYSYCNASNSNFSSIGTFCIGDYGNYYYPKNGSGTSERFVWCGSGAKPNCTLTNNTLDPNNSSQCVEPPHVCVIPEDPLKANCYFPDDQGAGLNCLDGSTVYAPEVCESSFFDRYVTPPEGVSITCPDGRVTSSGQSCYSRYLEELFNNDPAALNTIKFVGFGTSNLPTLSAIRPMLVETPSGSGGAPGLSAVFPMKQIDSYGQERFFNIASTVPPYSLGQTLSNYFKSEPTSTFANDFKARAAEFDYPVDINPNTGAVTHSGSSIVLTPNQVAQIATTLTLGRVATATLPAVSPLNLPVQQMTDFLTPESFPWMGPGVSAIEQDFQIVSAPTGTRTPVNFPQITNSASPLITPYPVSNTAPLVTFSPSSPQTYIQPVSIPTSTLPSPITNSNPTGTDTQTTSYTPPDPNTTIDPAAPELPPTPPTIYPDTWKYFDWLPMENPLHFDPLSFLPELPEPTCYYEVHSSFHVPYLGTKHLDVAPCVPLQPLRAVLAWVFSILTVFACFFVIFRSNF
jgi:hypothetical protein